MYMQKTLFNNDGIVSKKPFQESQRFDGITCSLQESQRFDGITCSLQESQRFDGINLQDAIIAERDKELKEIQQEMTEINKLFQQIDEDINAQGDDINRISDHIQSSNNDTKHAVESIRGAEKEQDKSRSLYLYIVGGVTSAAVIGGAVISAVLLL
jgi:hypothetical protein